MIKALRLAWIPRLLTPEIRNWKKIPDYYLRKIEQCLVCQDSLKFRSDFQVNPKFAYFVLIRICSKIVKHWGSYMKAATTKSRASHPGVRPAAG